MNVLDKIEKLRLDRGWDAEIAKDGRSIQVAICERRIRYGRNGQR